MDYFAGLVGQEKTIKFLQRIISNRDINHAYLFWGAAGIGKMQAARAFAHALISQEDYQAHIYLKEGIHPDLNIIEIIEGKTRISREQIVKELEPWLAKKPYQAQHRVVLIRDAHLMTPEASNALLKTLEEPPAHSLIILVADDQNILETIVSRCTVISFNPPARLAQGNISTAVRLGEAEKFQELWSRAIEVIQEIYQGGMAKAIETAQGMDDDAELLITTIEAVLRDLLVYEKSKDAELLHFPASLNLKEMLGNIDYNGLEKAIIDIDRMKKYYNSNMNKLGLNINICFSIWDAINSSQKQGR
jgi:DNA polymerase-3 subunit delta'